MPFGARKGGGSFGRSPHYQPKRFEWPMPGKSGGHHLMGLNDRDDPTRLHPNEVAVVKNVVFRQDAVQRRNGTTKWLAAALAAAVKGFFYGQDAGGVDKFLAFANKSAYLLPSAQGGVVTDTAAGFATADITGAVQYLGKVYAVNGTVDGLRQWDFAAWSAVAPSADADNDFVNAKKCQYLTGSHDRLYGAGNPAFPQTVYISDLAKGPIYFPSGGEVTVDTSDGQPITGLTNFDDWIVVWKSRSIHTIPPLDPGSTVFRRYLNHPTLGCPNGHTAAVYREGMLFFLGSDGHIHRLERSGLNKEFIYPVRLSGRIQATLAGFTAADRAAAWATIYSDQYMLHIGTKVLVLDLLQSDLRREEGCIWTVLAYESVDVPVLFTRPSDGTVWGGAANGQVYKLDQGNQDDGTPIEWTVQTGWWDFGLPEYYKVYDRLYLSAKAVTTVQSFTLTADLDMQQNVLTLQISLTGTGFTLGTAVLGGTPLGLQGEALNRTVPTPLQGKRIRFKFSRYNDTDTVLIWNLTTYWIPISPL